MPDASLTADARGGIMRNRRVMADPPRDDMLIMDSNAQPTLVHASFDALDERVRRAFNHHDILSIKRIVLTGAGDAYAAACDSLAAFEQLGALPVETIGANALTPAATAGWPQQFPRNPLLLAVSFGANNADDVLTLAALHAARSAGALTAVLTPQPLAQLGRAAHVALDTSAAQTDAAAQPHARALSLLTLLLFAIRIGEVRDLMAQEAANQLRRNLKRQTETHENPAALVAAALG
jgi:glucosamine 6-phosphate synthetase-like amidotransferase/phosphosugar isomerase protein